MPLRPDPPPAAGGRLRPGPTRHGRRLACGFIAAVALGLTGAGPALAAPSMVSIFQDDPAVDSSPQAALLQMRLAGATTVKVVLRWTAIAPVPNRRTKPRGFNGANPAAYPARNWKLYDEIVRDATADGMSVDFQLGDGAPVWATAPSAPTNKAYPNWDPSPGAFWAFVKAAGIRYSGRFRPKGQRSPLPRVTFWSVWNEPNLGFELAPQGIPGRLSVENSGRMYRGLLNAAWSALHQTGHGKDTILIGELGPRGTDHFGVFAAMKPLVFMRALYCVDSSFRPLRAFAAAERGCPTTAGASRRFRARNPALFNATGLGVHLWARWYPPNLDPQHDPDYSGLPDLPHFEQAVNRLLRVYGSRRQLPLYDTEFGYITNPPNHSAPFVSPAVASYYLNWAEYLSWRDPRLRSFSQYGLDDPTPLRRVPYTLWSSGLFTYTGRPKATYDAWRLPLYLPVTSTRRGRRLEVWGCARPASSATLDTQQPQVVQVQFAPGGSSSYATFATVTIDSGRGCYFDVRLAFPRSGTVRLAWQYPLQDSLLGSFATPKSAAVVSRAVQITVK
jgi:hypothetical protein